MGKKLTKEETSIAHKNEYVKKRKSLNLISEKWKLKQSI
jgi:hypothetical protein